MRVDYDGAALSLTELLGYYYSIIDPLSVNRQGGDAGVQYRTGIYYTDEADGKEARLSLGALEKAVGAPVAVELAPLENFYPAEEYHQKYLDKNPSGYYHIDLSKPKERRI